MAGKLRGMALLTATIVLVLPWLGCVRQGIILRGDWSLELNRVPWVNGRNIAHEEAAGNGCTAPDTFGPAVSEVSGIGGGPANCGPAGCGPANCGPAGCNACRSRAVPAGPSKAAMAQAGYYNHPRFHPVPTRPVFAPQPRFASANGPMEVPQSSPELDAPLPPTPAPPLPGPATAPEPVPAPSGEASSQWRAKPSGTATLVSQQESWVFAPSAEPKAVGPELREARLSPPKPIH